MVPAQRRNKSKKKKKPKFVFCRRPPHGLQFFRTIFPRPTYTHSLNKFINTERIQHFADVVTRIFSAYPLTSILTTTTSTAATTVPKKYTDDVSKPSFAISSWNAPYDKKKIANDVRAPYNRLRKKIFLLNSRLVWPGTYNRGYLEQPFSETSCLRIITILIGNQLFR